MANYWLYVYQFFLASQMQVVGLGTKKSKAWVLILVDFFCMRIIGKTQMDVEIRTRLSFKAPTQIMTRLIRCHWQRLWLEKELEVTQIAV